MSYLISQMKDSTLVAWSLNFATRIVAGPLPLGLTNSQAENFQDAMNLFTAKYNLAVDPGTRSPAAIVARNSARTVVTSQAKNLVAIINSTPNVSPEQKTQLGIPVRKKPARRPVPTAQMFIEITRRNGTDVDLRLHTGDSAKRGLPADVTAAALYTFVGPVAPTDPAEWVSRGFVTKSTTTLDFDAQLPAGTPVWITGLYMNARGGGPTATPVGTYLAGGGGNLKAA